MADGQLLDLTEPRPVPRPHTPTLMDQLDSMLGKQRVKPEVNSAKCSTPDDAKVTKDAAPPQQTRSNLSHVTHVNGVDEVNLDERLKEIQEKFGGRWSLTRSDPYDEYLKTVGVGYVSRKLAANSSLETEIQVDDGFISVWQRAAMYTEQLKARLDREVTNIVEKQAEAVRVTCTYHSGRLSQQLTPVSLTNTRSQSVDRRITAKGELEVIHTCGDNICRRYFTKIPEVNLS